MLDDDPVLEDRDLGVAGADVRGLGADLVAHHHQPVHCLPAGQEFGFGQNRRATAASVAAVPTALTLRLQPRRAADALDLTVALGLFARRALVNDGVGRIVGRCGVLGVVAPAGLTAPAAAPAASRSLPRGGFLVVGVGGVVILGLIPGLPVIAVRTGLLTPAATATTAAATTAPPGGALVPVLVLVVIIVIVIGAVGEFRRDGLVCGRGIDGAAGGNGLRRNEERHVGR